MPRILRVTACLLASGLIVAGCGDDATGPGGILPDDYSLGWGREIADGVRDSEYPEGYLYMISCIDVNDSGEPETAISWQFNYGAPGDSNNVLIVIVQYIGTTNTLWESDPTVPDGELPDYDDAGPWVEAAREQLGSQYGDWEEYALLVKGNDYSQFPWVLNVAVLQFMLPDTTEQMTAVIDADTDSVLVVFNY
ncbi:MAG: hypothetical protein AVO35_11715 [Candidatus Aegiribacteria sp. MLS_C]|nr:MAG: hypothetical protein AVO35_11715 [Candidatus Aegiribacteria sp. MLS_C]